MHDLKFGELLTLYVENLVIASSISEFQDDLFGSRE